MSICVNPVSNIKRILRAEQGPPPPGLRTRRSEYGIEIIEVMEQTVPLIASLARLKNSIELGSLGEVVKGVDVVPAATYQALGKLGAVVSDPVRAERFLSYPGAERLTRNPRILALRDDPEIVDLINQQRYLELLQNPKLIDALNDPTLTSDVQHFEFQKALDYALQGKKPAE